MPNLNIEKIKEIADTFFHEFKNEYESIIDKYFNDEAKLSRDIGLEFFPDLNGASVVIINSVWEYQNTWIFNIYRPNDSGGNLELYYDLGLELDTPVAVIHERQKSFSESLFSDNKFLMGWQVQTNIVMSRWFSDRTRKTAQSIANNEYQKYLDSLPKTAKPVIEKLTPAIKTLGNNFANLLNSHDTPQAKGRVFERLILNLMNIHGWNAKSVYLGHEQNDISAMHGSQYVLGEVKMEKKAIGAPEIRNFLSKLDPRPSAVGLFFSYSGYTESIYPVLNNASQNKIVLLFDRDEIDLLFQGSKDLNSLYQKKLRERYEHVYS